MIDNFYIFLGCVIFACLIGLVALLIGLIALLINYFNHDKK